VDVALVSEKTIRIKGKTSTVIVDPTSSMSKSEASTIILTHPEDSTLSEAKVEGSRITIKGPGDYEVGGIKIVAVKVNSGFSYLIDVDDVKLLVGKGSEVMGIYEKIEAFHIAVINADKEFKYSQIPSLDVNVVLVYGEKKEDVVKSLGKNSQKMSKYSVTYDNLPSEMQLIILER